MRLDQALAPRCCPSTRAAGSSGWIDAGRVTRRRHAWSRPGTSWPAARRCVVHAPTRPPSTARSPPRRSRSRVVYEDDDAHRRRQARRAGRAPGQRQPGRHAAQRAAAPRADAAARAAGGHRAPPRQGHQRAAGRREDARGARPRSCASSRRARCTRDYLALARGDLARAVTIDAPIGRHPVQRTTMAVVDARQARAHPLRRRRALRHRDAGALPARDRAHAPDPRAPRRARASAGRRPGLRRPQARCRRRCALRAAGAARVRGSELVHPVTGAHAAWTSALPADFAALLAALRARTAPCAMGTRCAFAATLRRRGTRLDRSGMAGAGDASGASRPRATGGVSTGPYATMNLGPTRLDDRARAARGDRRQPRAACARVPASGARAGSSRSTAATSSTIDATQRRGAARAAPPVADARSRGCRRRPARCAPPIACRCCSPIATASVVGVAHAGWRGLAAGVLEATVAAMARPGVADLSSPGWDPRSGRTRSRSAPTCATPSAHSDPGAAAASLRDARRGKWHADLPALARRRLAARAACMPVAAATRARSAEARASSRTAASARPARMAAWSGSPPDCRSRDGALRATAYNATLLSCQRRTRPPALDPVRQAARLPATHDRPLPPSSSPRSPAACSRRSPRRPRSRCTRSWISRLVSFAVGALLGAVFLELLPHALEEGDVERVMITVLAGLLAFFLLEKLVLWRHSHGHGEHDRRADETEHDHALHARARRRPLGPHDPDRHGRAQFLRRRSDRRVVPRRPAPRHRGDGRDRRARRAAAGRRFRGAAALRLHAQPARLRVQRRRGARHARRRAGGLLRARRHAADRCPRCSPSPRRACSTSRWPT